MQNRNGSGAEPVQLLEPGVRGPEARPWRVPALLAGVYLLALAVRVAVGAVTGVSQPLGDDEPEFYLPAVHLANGEGYRKVPQQSPDGIAHPTAYRMPGPSLVLALCFTTLGSGVELARWVSAIVGSRPAPLMYLFARRFMPTPVAVISCVACALYPTWAYYCLRVYSEPYFIPALLLALTLSLRAAERGTVGAALVAGLAWGATTLIRPHGLPMGVIVAIYLGWRSGWRPAAGLLLGVAAVLASWGAGMQLDVHRTLF